MTILFVTPDFNNHCSIIIIGPGRASYLEEKNSRKIKKFNTAREAVQWIKANCVNVKRNNRLSDLRTYHSVFDTLTDGKELCF